MEGDQAVGRKMEEARSTNSGDPGASIARPSNLKEDDDDANDSNDGDEVGKEEGVSASAEHHEHNNPSKRKPEVVFKSSLRKRNNEKRRRIQWNSALSRLLELIIEVEPASGPGGLGWIDSEHHPNTITNRGQLIEYAIDFMKRLMNENRTYKARIAELESELSAQTSLPDRTAVAPPPGSLDVTPAASSLGEQIRSSDIPTNTATTNSISQPISQHDVNQAYLRESLLNSVSHSGALRGLLGQQSPFQSQTTSFPLQLDQLLAVPNMSLPTLGQDLLAAQTLLYSGTGAAFASPDPSFGRRALEQDLATQQALLYQGVNPSSWPGAAFGIPDTSLRRPEAININNNATNVGAVAPGQQRNQENKSSQSSERPKPK